MADRLGMGAIPHAEGRRKMNPSTLATMAVAILIGLVISSGDLRGRLRIDGEASMSDELKRCPFCGSNDIRVCVVPDDNPKSESGEWITVGCYDCGTMAQLACLPGTKDESIGQWNTRPIEDELTAEISRLTSELTNGRELLAMALAEGERLTAEVESLTTYCDKLAAGYPDGMLPTDVKILRDANWTLAQQVHDRDAEIESLRLQLELYQDYE